MTPLHVISQLLESDTKYPGNLELLKKIILTAYLGRFRVNSLAPDNQVALGHYLFDEENLIFDFTRLTTDKRTLFFQWLLDPHENEKQNAFLMRTAVNEYRGFTAEVELSWWGRLNRSLQRKKSDHWKINDLGLSLNYQLTGIDICHGQQGLLIGFNQLLVPPSGTKYKGQGDQQREPLGNTKRVYLSDQIVDQLTTTSIGRFNIEALCKKPHPQSVDVNNYQARYLDMHDYRVMQKFIALKPFYIRLWRWLMALIFSEKTEKPLINPDNDLHLIHETEGVSIHLRSRTKEIMVREKKPDIDNLVFCGGGTKIFAHVGVWQALTEANIRPTQFAGSSAGAIMALVCYLDYSPDEIIELFKHFKQEHLVNFELINRRGLSEPHALKTALDYAIANKINQLVEKYKIPYPEGIITFETLDTLRRQCNGCRIGHGLVVTTTNKRLRQTYYHSLSHSPKAEVSLTVATSSSLPIIYRPTVLDGEEHNDGGVLSNLPTEVFSDDHSTLLESEDGNNLKVLAVQFDNGTERNTIDRVRDKVYRENFILNWIYSVITGVKDPASGWEQDRIKLRKHAGQSIVVNVGKVSMTSLSTDESSRVAMISKGYEATRSYLQARYQVCGSGYPKNKEIMYSTFSSLGDLLAYCCYRGDKKWFETVNNLIVQSELPNRTALMKQSIALRSLYFKEAAFIDEENNLQPSASSFFGNNASQKTGAVRESGPQALFLVLYRIFLKLSPTLFNNNQDKRKFEQSRNAINLQTPLACLTPLLSLEGETHILVQIIIVLMKVQASEQIYHHLNTVCDLLYTNKDLNQASFYGRWDISLPQSLRLLKLLQEENLSPSIQLAKALRSKSEPLQRIRANRFYDDFSDGDIENEEDCIVSIVRESL